MSKVYVYKFQIEIVYHSPAISKMMELFDLSGSGIRKTVLATAKTPKNLNTDELLKVMEIIRDGFEDNGYHVLGIAPTGIDIEEDANEKES